MHHLTKARAACLRHAVHVQVSTPADYVGPVTVSFAAPSGNTAITFNITPQLVVKVIASAFTSG